MKAQISIRDELLAEVKSLRQRLREAEETLEAIRSGAVDALVVAGPQGDRVYTLSGAAEPYRILIEEMNQGAATLSDEGVILYCNPLFAKLVDAPIERVMGASVASYIVSADREKLDALLQTGCRGRGADEVTLQTGSGNTVPVRLAVSCLPPHAGAAICLMATDLTGERRREQTLLDLMDDVVRTKQAVEGERRRFFDVLETLPMMICLLTPDYRVPFANRAFRERFGEAEGRRCYEYCFGRSSPCEFCEALKVLQTGQPHHWVMNHDGFMIEVHDYPFSDTDGSPMVLEMDIDVTERVQTEERLRLASLYNRSLIEASLDPLVTIGADGKITDVNVATESATGRSRSELVGTDFCDYFTEPEKARAGYQQAFREGLVRDCELGLRHRDGPVMPVLYNASVYRDELGKVIGVFAAARDITGRKQAEEILQRERERFNKVLNQLPAYVILLSPDYHVPFANQFFEERFGKALGRRCFEYLFQRNTPCENCETYKVLKDHAPHRWEWVGPDGRNYDIYDFPFTDADGSGLIMEVGLDITERKKAEAEIRQLNADLEKRVVDRTRALTKSEERFRTIYDMAPVSIWQEDWTDVIAMIRPLRTEGVTDFAAWFQQHPEFVSRALAAVRILDVNQWTVGLFKARNKGDILTSLEKVFAAPGTIESFIGELVALAQGQTLYRAEMNVSTMNGETICGLVAMSFPPPESDSGSVLVSIVDITARKRAEEQIQRLIEELRQRAAELETANKELESFSYSVSHDLRAPLRGIDGFSRLILEKQKDKLDPQGREHLQRIRAATLRMGQLIDDLLSLSAVGRRGFKWGSVNLSRLAQTVADELHLENPERRVEWSIAPSLCALGDAHLLSIVLENLLRNAWKFTGRQPAPKIEFGTMPRKGAPVFFVRDNGAGFNMAYAGKLFGPFQRLHSAADFSGTGIGLALVQRIIHRHGGTIEAEAELGQGATFYFTLPASERKAT